LVITCATSNPGKLAEFQHAAPPGWQVASASRFDCPETGHSFAENAAQKALCCAAHTQALVFADDSGLEVEALGGAPGIHSARYAGPHATDEQNRARLLESLRGLRIPPGERPRARFVCVVALAVPGRLLASFEGTAEGEILEAPRGTGGFGYDPLFYFPALGRTFAELSAAEKLRHSHRGKAFRQLLQWLEEHKTQLEVRL
jgi:XTP/dITP diphosphohydrolase